MSCLQTWTMPCTPIQNNLLQLCYFILRSIAFWYNVFSILEGFLQLVPKKLGKLWSRLSLVKWYIVKHINPFPFNFFFFVNHDREQLLASLGTGENILLRLILISFNVSLIMLLLHQLEIPILNQTQMWLAPIQVHLKHKMLKHRMQLIMSKVWKKNGLQRASKPLFVDFWYCYFTSS